MATEAVTPIVSETPDQPVAPPTLAEFRESFPAELKPGQADPVQDKAPRRRAKSHQADAEDVDTINTLTRELREAEDAIKIDRNDGESDRVYNLRRRAEIARRANKPVAAEPVRESLPARQQPVQRPVAIGEFTDKEPTLDQFADKPDPYAEWQRALARFDRKKDDFESRQAVSKEGLKAQEETFNREIATGMNLHAQRIGTFLTQNADAKSLFEIEAGKPIHEQVQLTLALRGAIEFHEKGPDMMLALIKQPDLADELFLLTDGKPIGDPRVDPLVATVRRRLLQRVSGVGSGSPTPAKIVKLAPRPPNPERTVPQTPREKPSTEKPGSLASHRRDFPTA